MSEARGKEQRQELNIKIGKRCKEARLAAKLTQEKLGELLDVNSQFISDVERGCVGVSLLTLKNLLEILNVTTDYLLKGEEIENKTINNNFANYFQKHLNLNFSSKNLHFQFHTFSSSS